MKRRVAIAGGALVAVLALAAPPVPADDAGYRDPPRRDEFGVVPEDPHDKDLALPDPVLDRTWPGPKPGEGPRALEREPEEDDDRLPGPGDDAGPPARRKAPAAADPYESRRAPRPKPPLVGPDGRRDPGSPAPELDPSLPDVLGKDAPDLSDLERDEARPSSSDPGRSPSGDPYEDPAGAPDPGAGDSGE